VALIAISAKWQAEMLSAFLPRRCPFSRLAETETLPLICKPYLQNLILKGGTFDPGKQWLSKASFVQMHALKALRITKKPLHQMNAPTL
jgi:hypothetical protein